jgi:uncharacterized protein (DUF433 family)
LARGAALDKLYVETRDGGYWVSGTRVSLDSIVLAFLEGLSPETIAGECLPILTLEQVYGAIAYYLAHRSEIDAHLTRADVESDALRQLVNNADPDFSRKLAEARRQVQTAGS